MLIGELATRTGCSRDTLRFYEKRGLVEGTRGRAQSNTYKHYDEKMVERLGLIQKAKLLGFTLGEIKGLMIAWETNTLSPAQKVKIFTDRMVLLDQKIAELTKMRKYLKKKLAVTQGL